MSFVRKASFEFLSCKCMKLGCERALRRRRLRFALRHFASVGVVPSPTPTRSLPFTSTGNTEGLFT